MKSVLTAVILAGGKSSRMGQDKGLLTYQGRFMIEPILEVAGSFSKEIFISTQNAAYSQFHIPLIHDVIENQGPLGGISSAFHKTEAKDILFLSCDIPNLTIEVIDRLLKAHLPGKITVAKHQDKVHPLIGIYSKECLEIIMNKLKINDLKVMNLLDVFPTNLVDMSDLDAKIFSNINSKNDL